MTAASEAMAGSELAAASGLELGEQGPEPGPTWLTGAQVDSGPRLPLEHAERHAATLAEALASDELTATQRAELLEEVNELLAPAAVTIVDPHAIPGPTAPQRARAAAEALAATLQTPSPHGTHRAQLWGASVRPFRRLELELRRLPDH